ncbi:hypothetical protein BD324DRAFT_654638 [Kockovaella imperatae]|uniref:VPS9 domain-containing protein n=1 Tax=Kockovaella imperatae TaxID=4999 RepID=A0A1Y1USN5_9TREE|nr:hypothetical protein BD324DRAFT_654638 [Kockovaella imperatae]ORX41021.1 hypothetical protein BD324DRAFT_654638 [Kockovaella imperatae]
MPSDSPKHGLLSTLTLGRSSRSSKPVSETLTHPLLGASTSSLNLVSDGVAEPSGSTSHTRQSSGGRSGQVDVTSLPYKPRHKPGQGPSATGVGADQSGSIPTSLSATGGPSTSPNVSTLTVPTSPVTPTSVSARPTTSTFTSTTFALPPSAVDSNDSQDLVASIGSSSTATSRLQLQSLKAAVQRIGLGNGSMGMSMIDTIFERSLGGASTKGKSVDNGEWAEIVKILMTGKAILLLPTTPASSSLPLTAQNVRDHVAFVGPALPDPRRRSIGSPADNGAMVVTLSGLLGTMKDSTIFFESVLGSDTVPSLLGRDTGLSTALGNLRPAHHSSPSAQSHFPLYALSSQSTSLRFPPTMTMVPAAGDETRSTSAKFGRINPFASLFGGSSATAVGSNERGDATPSPKLSVSPLDPDGVSVRSSDESIDGYQVPAFTIAKAVRINDVAKSIVKATKAIVKAELDHMPEKLVDRVIRLVCPTVAGIASDEKSDASETIQLDFTDPNTTGQKLQEFVEKAYDDLVLHFRADSSHIFSESSHTGSRLRQKASWTRKLSMSTGDEENEAAKARRKQRARKEREEMVEREATSGAEKIEGLLCKFFYNRQFSPPDTDDSRHDEALSSRIAALNMLELSLDHLGLVTRPPELPMAERDRIARGLEQLVDNVGLELQKLDSVSAITPGGKVAVLISAHKAVVDGLQGLPPIRLRPEGEAYQPSREETSTPVEDRVTSAPPIKPDLAERRRSSSSAQRGVSMPIAHRSSTGSTPLSTSPATTDPLRSIGEAAQESGDLPSEHIPGIPEVVLTESGHEQMEEAMKDSVIDLQSPATGAEPEHEKKVNETSQSGATSGADLILPIIIYAVVKANPPQLASHLMYIRRFRSAICLTGEASYAIVNLTAVIDFIEHVQLADLGLGHESDKVISVDNLSPIGLNDLDNANADTASIATASSRLRGRVFQVGELAGSAADSANKVITGVVDSSWTAIRGLISSPAPNITATEEGQMPPPADVHPEAVDGRARGNSTSAFSLSSVTASMAGIAAAATNRNRSRAGSRASALERPEHTWKGNEEMIDVSSKPGSIREGALQFDTNEDEAMTKSDDDEHVPVRSNRERRRSDARSIQSVSSVFSRDKEEARAMEKDKDRVSLSDRLASIGALGRLPSTDNVFASSSAEVAKPTGFLANLTVGRSTPPPDRTHARKASLLSRAEPLGASPAGSITSLPALPENADPPLERFMTCEAGDLKLSEIGSLLRDYRRLGDIVNALGAQGQTHLRA